MAAWMLLADAATDVAVALGYGAVAWRASRRELADEERATALPLSLWWWGLSVTGVLAAFLSALALGKLDMALFGTISFLIVVAFTLGMAGLAVHLAARLAPRRAWLRPAMMAPYVAFGLLQAWLLVTTVPHGVVLSGWRPILDAASPPPWIFVASFLLFFAPPFAAAGAYALRGGPREHVVAVSLLLWLASVAIISWPDTLSAWPWQAAARLMVVASAGAMAIAWEREDLEGTRSLRPISEAV